MTSSAFKILTIVLIGLFCQIDHVWAQECTQQYDCDEYLCGHDALQRACLAGCNKAAPPGERGCEFCESEREKQRCLAGIPSSPGLGRGGAGRGTPGNVGGATGPTGDNRDRSDYRSGLIEDACGQPKKEAWAYCKINDKSTQCRNAQRALSNMGCGGTVNNSEDQRCRDQSQKYNEQTAKISPFCGRGFTLTACAQRLENCMSIMNNIGNNLYGIQNADQQNLLYGQALTQVDRVDPNCGAALRGMNKDFIEDTRKDAVEKVRDIEKQLRDIEKDRLESQVKSQEDLFRLQENTKKEIKEYKNQVDNFDDEMRKIMRQVNVQEVKNKESFKEKANKLKQAMDDLETQHENLKNLKPNVIAAKFDIAVAKIESECQGKAREKAEKKRIENEGKKASYRYANSNLNSLLASTSNTGSPQKRYILDRNREMRLCLQDRAKEMEALRKQKELELMETEIQIAQLIAKKRDVEIAMQDLVDAAKDADKLVRNEAEDALISVAREKQKALIEASDAELTYYQRSQQLQMQSLASAQLQYSLVQQLYQQKSIAESTIMAFPPRLGGGGGDGAKNFTEAYEALDTRESYRGSAECCDQNYLRTLGVNVNFCSNDRGYGTSPYSPTHFPSWGGGSR